MKGSVLIDNQWIVPYCRQLSLALDCDVKVEVRGSTKAIAYLTSTSTRIVCSVIGARHIFALILMFNGPSAPKALWERHLDELLADFDHHMQRLWNDERPTRNQMEDLELDSLETNLIRNNSTLEELRLRSFAASRGHRRTEGYICQSDDSVLQKGECANLHQRTGWDFLYKLFLAATQAKGLLALASSSLGLSATLLPGGKTTHWTYAPLLILRRNRTGAVKPRQERGKLLNNASLLVQDEAYAAIDKSLRDLTKVDERFGGEVIIFGGHFRRTLPIVTGGTEDNPCNISFKYSRLWNGHFVSSPVEIGNKTLLRVKGAEDTVVLPPCIAGRVRYEDFEDAKEAKQEAPLMLTQEIYSEIHRHVDDKDWIAERVIVAPQNSEEDDRRPILFACQQFPIRLAFAMTINKSQGQTIQHVGVYLKTPCFSQRQLYIAMSPVMDNRNLTILPIGRKLSDKNGWRPPLKAIWRRFPGSEFSAGTLMAKMSDMREKYQALRMSTGQPAQRHACPKVVDELRFLKQLTPPGLFSKVRRLPH
ncbi:PIF1-like helicase-domain-containing protein [Blyttiomyces helicus]|uniref:ATP-dependent DNA helicase n=1 Tax=Blyttiomyces helicus TaxID=388810 RepID=A0A4P9WLL7_9FUNG|nr:PIF1-like helicase-domain-containing protein [Blyttiomyces helicus]|eukprot:RKO93312.1 PIF1-like helicase-domain-containing protein [Blyttiomyces helicus]